LIFLFKVDLLAELIYLLIFRSKIADCDELIFQLYQNMLLLKMGSSCSIIMDIYNHKFSCTHMKIGFFSNTDRVFGFRLRPRNLDGREFIKIVLTMSFRTNLKIKNKF
jgi:hypothetical protein